MKKKVIGCLTVLIFTVSCASKQKSILLGSTIAGVAGGAMGQQMGRDSKSTAVGAAIGAVVGGLIGYAGYKEKQKKERLEKFNLPKEEIPPFLTKPKVKMLWVPDQIIGNKYVEGHRTWIIESQSQWTK